MDRGKAPRWRRGWARGEYVYSGSEVGVYIVRKVGGGLRGELPRWCVWMEHPTQFCLVPLATSSTSQPPFRTLTEAKAFVLAVEESA